MPLTLQVIYPIGEDTNFDYDYYLATHMPIVQENMGAHISHTTVSKGLAGGPDVPPPYYAIATMEFDNTGDLNSALAKSGPVMEDIPKFTNTTPQMLIGEVLVRYV